MTKTLWAFCALLSTNAATAQVKKLEDTTLMQPVEVLALRASEYTPVTQTTLSAAALQAQNTGRDLPFLLNNTPSVVVNSDAGNGIGYTGIRIRGTDLSRINVTINNIPYNDPESQATFFVDIPDLASSASSIQIQRGVGTSTNGPGAFGGNINISTNDIRSLPKLECANAAGSYGSLKNTLLFNSGLIKNKFLLDGRLSRIVSNGYIDRAFSRLYSGFLTAAWVLPGYSLRLNVISGKEKTYQAWYGVREDILDTNRRYNPAGTEKPGAPYDNETDNYRQTQYQLFQNMALGNNWKASLALFLTRGKGYYEQYKADQTLSSYGLPDYDYNGTIISSTDLIRRLWLDNYYYGAFVTIRYKKGKTDWISGAGHTRYDGRHYGETVSSLIPGAVPPGYLWYDLDAFKSETNAFSKWQYRLGKNWTAYLDGQIRIVNYAINGFRDNPELRINNDYFFLNPKIGITYNKNKWTAYLSCARVAKEPNRDDFEAAADEQPKPEKLMDIEAGTEYRNSNLRLSANLFFMKYSDQLVLTGKINDVGAYARTNIPKSYRAGIELSTDFRLNDHLSCFANAAFSRNKVSRFTEYIFNYDNNTQESRDYRNTDLSYSPAIVAGAGLRILIASALTITYDCKYVSRQYLDNTSAAGRSLDPFPVQNLKIDYDRKISGRIQTKWFVQANNLFSGKYEPNGYTFSYIYGGETLTENYYYPMAPLNILTGVNIIIN